jgi:RHS repeat-associated protein
LLDHTDHLNTPRLVADSTGTTVWRWDQAEPFGNNPANDDPDGNQVAFDLPLRLPGQYLDKETGLYQNARRDYSPGDGRYVESDPIGLYGGVQTYGYAENQPVRLIDPLGLRAQICCRDLPVAGIAGFKHCYVNVESGGSRGTHGLIGGALSGMPGCGQIIPDNGFDTGGECGNWKEDCGTDECVKKAIEEYPNPSGYSLLGPNSNTFAGTVARKCGLERPGLPPINTPGWGSVPAGPYPGLAQIPPGRTRVCPFPPPEPVVSD